MDKSTPSTEHPEKRITFFPSRLPESIVINPESTILELLPWGPPSLVMVPCRRPKDELDDRVLVLFEWPIPVLSPVIQMSKEQMERLHLERFLTDYAEANGSLVFEGIQQGPGAHHRPDFTVVAKKRPERLDCTH